MKEPYRRKLRNCIRKDTFQYYIGEKDIKNIWKSLESEFGKASEITGFRLLVIENEKLIIRRAESEDCFTLIKKKKFVNSDETKIHKIIGMNG